MKISAVIFLLLQSSIALAGMPEPVLVTPAERPTAGQTMIFSVYLHNAGEKAIYTDLPDRIICRLENAEQAFDVTASAVQPPGKQPEKIISEGFIKIRYSLTIPESVKGVVKMNVPAFSGAGVMFMVNAGPLVPPETEALIDDDSEAHRYTSLDSLFSLYQPYLGNITAYEPMYFLVGADPEKSKFQVSFKYRLFNTDGPLALRQPWVKGLHFAFTQTSFWDLASSSMPFEDTSYKPELFYRSLSLYNSASGVRRLFLQTGFQHESNGRSGENSRSTNFFYVTPTFILYNETSRLGLQLSPKIWTYLANDEDTNPNLEDYRGYFDLELKLGRADSLVLGSHLRWAKKGGSLQVDLTYPLRHVLFDSIDLYFQAQYVNSLAESLLNYKRRNEAVRLGIAIVR